MRSSIALLLAIFWVLPSYGKDCGSVLKLSAVSTGSSLNKDTFIQRATKFCDEYNKHKSKGTQQSLSVSYMDIGVGGSSGSSSVDAVASKYCKSDTSKEVNNTAYESFSNSIAPGGFDAYQACLKSGEEGLDFAITSGLEKEATIALGFNSKQKNGIASIEISSSAGIDCNASSDKIEVSDLKLEMIDNSTVKVKCTRKDSSSNGTISIIRYNSGQVDSSIGIPWTAYSGGLPTSLVTQYENAVATHAQLTSKLANLEQQLSSTAKNSKDNRTSIGQIENGSLRKPTLHQCDTIKKPDSCRDKWDAKCPAGKVMAGVYNVGGNQPCSIPICCSVYNSK